MDKFRIAHIGQRCACSDGRFAEVFGRKACEDGAWHVKDRNGTWWWVDANGKSLNSTSPDLVKAWPVPANVLQLTEQEQTYMLLRELKSIKLILQTS